ncbi:MAG: cation diffusion facilitator family transporter [Methanobacteriales archaeon]|nr:cation diffusion facilitator family transporter [Methanobacteriales archaeon]MBC7118303.1 cation diffusion facilitator family transporter [Methanobacteriaceae archaeon]
MKFLKEGEKAAKYSTYANIFLMLIKGVVGLLSGSLALVADALHSLVDIFASASVFIGLRLSQRKPDEMFPYGYYRIETFASLIVSITIIITGFEIGMESFSYILNPSRLMLPFLALFVSMVSVFVSYFFAVYKKRIGKKIGSQALINDGRHSFLDVISSMVVFFGILLEYLGLRGFQGFAGILIAILIIYLGLKLARYDILVLLDACIDQKSLQILEEIVLGVKGVKGIHDVKVRRSGPYLFAELHLELERGMPLKKIEEIISQVNDRVKEKIPAMDHLIIQPETLPKDYMLIAAPLEDNRGLESTISSHFGRANYFIIASVKDDKVQDFKIIENPGKDLEKKRGIKAAELLKDEEIDVLIIDHLSEGPAYVLSQHILGTTKPEGTSLGEIILNAYKKFR